MPGPLSDCKNEERDGEVATFWWTNTNKCPTPSDKDARTAARHSVEGRKKHQVQER